MNGKETGERSYMYNKKLRIIWEQTVKKMVKNLYRIETENVSIPSLVSIHIVTERLEL